MQQYVKVLVVGNAFTGKTTCVRQLINPNHVVSPIEEAINAMSVHTLGVEVDVFKTRNAVYNIWDTAGLPRYEGLGQGYYVGAQVVLLFEGEGAKTQEQWAARIQAVCPNVPIFLLRGSNREKLIQMQQVLQ
jgi:GTPase SAR1 family protein